MACNCGTKEEIDKLYRIYGEKLSSGKNETLIDKFKYVLSVLVTLIAWVIVFPLILLYMLFFLFWHEPNDRRINVQKFNLLKIFHLGKYARE